MRTLEVIADVSKRMGAYKKDVRELLLQHFRAALLDAVAKGEKVRLAGLGTFYPARKRKGKGLSVRFRPAAGFLRELNNANNAKECGKQNDKNWD